MRVSVTRQQPLSNIFVVKQALTYQCIVGYILAGKLLQFSLKPWNSQNFHLAKHTVYTITSHYTRFIHVTPKVAENQCMSPIINYQSLAKIKIFSIWCSNIYFHKIPKVWDMFIVALLVDMFRPEILMPTQYYMWPCDRKNSTWLMFPVLCSAPVWYHWFDWILVLLGVNFQRWMLLVNLSIPATQFYVSEGFPFWLYKEGVWPQETKHRLD